RKTPVFAADARHRALEEHQGEVLRLFAAELVEPPEYRAYAVERRQRAQVLLTPLGVSRIAQQAKPLLGEGEEDVVLARKVAVNRGRAVFDPLGDLPDGDVREPFGDEELARGIQDGSAYGFAIALVAFLDSH